MASFMRLCEGVIEEPLRFEGPNGPLHTVFYRPGFATSRAPVLIAPPDGEERDWALRSLVTAARSLAGRGCPVLRFDYFGQGESEGNYEDTTMGTRVADVLAVTRLLHDLTGQTPVLVALRLGGPVALLAALDQPAIRHLVLWEPVLDPDGYLQQLLRVNVSTQMVTHGRVVTERPQLIAEARAGQPVSVNGYQLSGTFIDGLLELDVLKALERFQGRTLAVTIGPLDRRVAALLRVTAARAQTAPFWKEPRIHTTAPTPFLGPTLEWLVEAAPQLREVS